MLTEEVVDDIKAIRRAVCGPANKPEEGLLIRVRDLELESKNRKRWTGALILALIGLMAENLWNRLLGRA